ncbi:hypothetical protein PUN28_012486 [Cardiocondyla obscurior]|uniref:Uncharacterized protein n=1 Tax=Cardiocondyla obscurior TaxID=286306 RepID=A0AAW2FHG1_9HYME
MPKRRLRSVNIINIINVENPHFVIYVLSSRSQLIKDNRVNKEDQKKNIYIIYLSVGVFPTPSFIYILPRLSAHETETTNYSHKRGQNEEDEYE